MKNQSSMLNSQRKTTTEANANGLHCLHESDSGPAALHNMTGMGQQCHSALCGHPLLPMLRANWNCGPACSATQLPSTAALGFHS